MAKRSGLPKGSDKACAPVPSAIHLEVGFSSKLLNAKGQSNGLGDRWMGEVAGDGVGVGPGVFEVGDVFDAGGIKGGAQSAIETDDIIGIAGIDPAVDARRCCE